MFMKDVVQPPDAADIIDRFLNGSLRYPQEWNDFIEAARVEERVELYRKQCYKLDPSISHPGNPDSAAIEALRKIASELRNL